MNIKFIRYRVFQEENRRERYKILIGENRKEEKVFLIKI